MTAKRIWILFAATLILMAALAVRLFQIQVIGLERVENAAAGHSDSLLKGVVCRGNIIDRNGIPFLERSEAYMIFVEKTKLDEKAKQYLKRISAEPVSLDNRRYYCYKTEKYDSKAAEIIEQEYGGYIFLLPQRYSQPQPAAHIIGYCRDSDNSGVFGIEKRCDDKLKAEAEVSLTVDAAGRIIKGYGLTESTTVKAEDVYVTLDYEIQSRVEEILTQKSEKGAAVVIFEAKSGDILCLASYPTFNPDRVESAKGSALINKAIQSSYPPGSVFKIIVAAAALEEGIVGLDEEFVCSGKENVCGIEIKCGKEEGHGKISFREAFEESCNCVFIQIGILLGNEKLIEMAEKFGIGEKVLSGFDEESGGSLASLAQTSGAGIGNLSVGQGETEITCIQAARIAGIIAGYGKEPQIHLFTDEENSYNEKRVISFGTALLLKQLMSGVVERGTGKNAGEGAAGKSGSAQSILNGEKTVHGWFTGFFPAERPEYIVAVLTEASGGAGSAVRIFGEIHEILK